MPKRAINKIGCHVSIAKGIWNAPANADKFGCETFQIFTRSPHGGPVAPLTPVTVEKFKLALKYFKYNQFVIHAPYILNFGSPNNRVYYGSVSIVRQELERGSLLGADYVMFHPGSINNNLEKGFNQVKEGFKKILKDYSGSTKLLIEITAGAGQVVGDTFEELAELMEPIMDHKGFGGICFDTQHAFGSGYDLRTPEAVAKTFKQFDKVIGLKWLKMSQMNDSKPELGSHRDRHEHIGEGKIGRIGFAAMLAYFSKHLPDIPLILETEHDKVQEDIKILKTLRDKVAK